MTQLSLQQPSPDPLWYKDAIIYQVHVRAFLDSNVDGIGDFAGLTRKLDYLQDLGVTALWLLPFYPSPLRDDGYDIANYTQVHPAYGLLADVRAFIREAHRRELRVITELVCNHTSDQHPWFQRARAAKRGSVWRDFYVWSDTPDRYQDARVIFRDYETSNWSWDPVAGAYYWHRFYHHQPDLNFENPRVRSAILKAMEFWLDLGVDGLRLDAVPYLYEAEGTNCENLPPTHLELKRFRAHIDQHYPGRMLLAEANQWPEDAVAYFGDGAGDECNMAFHFPVMPRMFMALRMEDRNPIVDILEQTPEIPETSQWAIFLRNHDELTLEMVTDEERDYMYRAYAQDPSMRINMGIRRRLAPLLGNSRRRIELLNALLFSLPGTPVIYYGDEIGMGDNVYLGDRNGVRTPMQWSGDRNAGFSAANRQQLYAPVIVDPEFHYEAVNVDAQQANPQSLLWWMKRVIALRREYPAFSRGALRMLSPANRKVLAFTREYAGETILVVMNLSRYVQAAELDLRLWEGNTPVELFGKTPFPAVGSLPYFITLGPHGFYWFLLSGVESLETRRTSASQGLPVIAGWRGLDDAETRRQLNAAIRSWLPRQSWSTRSGATITRVNMADWSVFDEGHLAVVEATYSDGETYRYVVPLSFQKDGETEHAMYVATVIVDDESFILADAFDRPGGWSDSLAGNGRSRSLKTHRGAIDLLTPRGANVVNGDQLGTGTDLHLRRRLELGVDPEIEVARITPLDAIAQSLAVVTGWLAYREGNAIGTLGVLRRRTEHQGTAEDLVADELRSYWDRCAPFMATIPEEIATAVDSPEFDFAAAPALAWDLIGPVLSTFETLGRRIGELHLALIHTGAGNFSVEPFSLFYQRSLLQSLRNLTRRTWDLVEENGTEEMQRTLAGLDARLIHYLRPLTAARIRASRVRVHGNLALSSLLFTGIDFVLADFMANPRRSLERRRTKQAGLADVAGVLHSIAAVTWRSLGSHGYRTDQQAALWARFWMRWIGAACVHGYRSVAAGSELVPADPAEFMFVLDMTLVDVALSRLHDHLLDEPGDADAETIVLAELGNRLSAG